MKINGDCQKRRERERESEGESEAGMYVPEFRKVVDYSVANYHSS